MEKPKADDLPGINTAHQKQYIKHIKWSFAYDWILGVYLKCHLNVLQAAHTNTHISTPANCDDTMPHTEVTDRTQDSQDWILPVE